MRGIALIVAASALFSAMDAMVKWLTADYSIVQIIFFRSAFAFIPLAPWLLREGFGVLRTTRPMGHLARSLIGLCAIFLFFHAFALLPLAEVTAVAFAAPLLMTALSVPLLGETVGLRRWAAILVGFAGVLIILRPGADGGGMGGTGFLVALGATAMYALAMVALRSLGTTERSVTTVFYFTLTATLAAAALLPWQWTTPSAFDALLFVGTGLLGGTAQLAMTQAVRLAPISLIAPFDYTHLLFAASWGFVLWGDLPGANTLLGAAVVVAAGLYVLHRERLKRAAP